MIESVKYIRFSKEQQHAAKINAKAGSPLLADERERFYPRQDRSNATTSFLK
jgi:hypothetical protein